MFPFYDKKIKKKSNPSIYSAPGEVEFSLERVTGHV